MENLALLVGEGVEAGGGEGTRVAVGGSGEGVGWLGSAGIASGVAPGTTVAAACGPSSGEAPLPPVSRSTTTTMTTTAATAAIARAITLFRPETRLANCNAPFLEQLSNYLKTFFSGEPSSPRKRGSSNSYR